MSLQHISFNPETGKFDFDPQDDPASKIFVYKSLITAMSANSCIAIVSNNVTQINSLYNFDIINRERPYVDGIVIKGGNPGDTATVASMRGMRYQTPLSLGTTGLDNLYLGQNGKITNVVPNRLNGDRWWVYLGRRVNEFEFIFDPSIPINLLTLPDNNPPTSPVTIPTDDKVTLSEPMSTFTCFRLGSDGKAFKVSINDDIIPIIEGMTLESGGIDSEVKVARLKNQHYTTINHYTDFENYWLSDNGIITNVRPLSGNYQVMVGHTVPNSEIFIFDPQMPIKLAN